jgi:pyruvate dehydrogenase E2 component (dihydrolipoamide acetyltransferase)
MRQAAPSGEDVVEDVPLTRIRQAIARRMQEVKPGAPHYYLQVDVDMSEALAFRKQANEALGEGSRITINDYIVLATTRALVQHPNFNAYWVDDHVQTHSQVNIGIAVTLDEGLMVPCLLDCANKGLAQLAFEARDLAERTRSGRLRPEEYNATFSISNLGAPQFGVDVLVAIINPPQVGVLGIGSVVEKPVVRAGEVVIRPLMTVVLSADHRASDGADGARFLQSVKRNLESPGLMLL